MIRQICNIKPEDVATIRSRELAKHEDPDLILRGKRIRRDGDGKLFSGADRTTCDEDVVRMCRPGRPKMLRKKLMEKDLSRVQANNHRFR